MSQDPSSSVPSSKTSVETSYVTLDSAQLFTKTWIPTTPIALLIFVHGFGEHIERYDHVFDRFAEHGIKTFAWDQRGFGRSAMKKSELGLTGGTDKALEDIDYFVKRVKTEAEKSMLPLFLWGHSMGGALALMYAATAPENTFRGVISQSPLFRLVEHPSKVVMFIGSFARNVVPNFRIHRRVPGSYISRDPQMAKKYDEDPLVHGTGTLFNIYAMLTRGEDLVLHPPVISFPLLVQHGTDDKVTSFEKTREFFEKLPPGNQDREFKVWDGYYHEPHNEPENERNKAIAYIAEWILARCKDTSAPMAKL